MHAVRADAWIEPSAATFRLRRIVLWALLAAKSLALWGLLWDIQWHIRVGRDSFWIPPHLMMYAGVAVIVLLSFGTLGHDTWRRRGGLAAEGELAVLGFVGTPGVHLAAWGIALTVLAAPIDDAWHRVFGIDVTLWSPPHLLGLAGSFINTAACLRVAHEVYPVASRVKTAALIVAAALLLFGFTLTAQQALHIAYVHGGLAFHLYAIVGTLVFPLPYLIAASHTRQRSAPLLVFIASLTISLIGVEIARLGFETVQPVAIGEAEIAKDPTSPIAIAQAIRRKSGDAPRSGPWTLAQWMALAPVLGIVAIDPRRRPVTATLVYGVALLTTMTWTLARSPAFAPLTPGAGVTLTALALTVFAALAAATIARRLSDALAAASREGETPRRPRSFSRPW